MHKIKINIIFLLLIVISGCVVAQPSALFQEIEQHTQGVGLWWAGHNGWIIKSDGLVVTTDILLDYDKRALASSISAEELARLIDVSFITHGHKDHFNRSTTAVLVDNSDCIFVIPKSCLAIAQELGIPQDRIKIATPREPFSIMGIEVEPLRAIHGNNNFAIYYKANLEDCGYVITIGGKRFLQPGDSFLLEDHLFQENIDVLFFSPTQHNMYIDPSIILINALNPEYILPQHHSTVVVNDDTRFWAQGYQHEVKMRLSNAMQKKYFIMAQGEKLMIQR